MKRIYLYMAFLAVLLYACNNGSRKETAQVAAGIPMRESESPGDQNKEKKQTGLVDQISSPEKNTPEPRKEISYENWDKRIIKTAEISLDLKDYKKYNQSLHEGLKFFGAYIAGEEQVADDNKQLNRLTIKVPVAQFDNLVGSFSGDGVKMLQKKISSDDVTEEVVDIKSRLEAKKQMRERYLGLLKQARNMKEILEVQAEINSIQEDIESASGRAAYLSHQSAYSTIHLTYFQYIDGGKQPEGETGYLFKLKMSFRSGVEIIGALFIFMVTLWPVILVATIVTILWKRRKTIRPENKKRSWLF
jgi:cbb3-type cytochrome oxidase subunit 3